MKQHDETEANAVMEFVAKLRTSLEYKDGKLFWVSPIPRLKHLIGRSVSASVRPPHGYKYCRLFGRQISEHRLIFAYHYGYLPETVDHIDQNKVNNRIENLRAATRGQNQLNIKKQSNNVSGYKGVSWYKNKYWRVQIRVNGTSVDVGYFDDKYDAATAYNFAISEIYKDFAVYNTVEQPWLNGEVHG